jgi:hypothetical protein
MQEQKLDALVSPTASIPPPKLNGPREPNVNGRSVGDVLRDVQARTGQIALPVGYSILQTGQGSQLSTAFGR